MGPSTAQEVKEAFEAVPEEQHKTIITLGGELECYEFLFIDHYSPCIHGCCKPSIRGSCFVRLKTIASLGSLGALCRPFCALLATPSLSITAYGRIRR